MGVQSKCQCLLQCYSMQQVFSKIMFFHSHMTKRSVYMTVECKTNETNRESKHPKSNSYFLHLLFPIGCLDKGKFTPTKEVGFSILTLMFDSNLHDCPYVRVTSQGQITDLVPLVHVQQGTTHFKTEQKLVSSPVSLPVSVHFPVWCLPNEQGRTNLLAIVTTCIHLPSGV